MVPESKEHIMKFKVLFSITLFAILSVAPSLHAMDHDDSPLVKAIEARNQERVEELIKTHPKAINEKINQLNETPLFLAIKDGNPEIVSALIKGGAYINIKNLTGHNPLFCAIISSRVAELIDDLYSDINSFDQRNEIIRMIIDAGALLNEWGPYGETPLMLAIGSSLNPTMTQTLLDSGASVLPRNHNQLNALEKAKTMLKKLANYERKPVSDPQFEGHNQIIMLLEDRMAVETQTIHQILKGTREIHGKRIRARTQKQLEISGTKRKHHEI